MNTSTAVRNLHFTVQNLCKLHNMMRVSRYALGVSLGLCIAALALSLFSPDSADIATSAIKQAGLLCILCLLGIAGVVFASHMVEGVREIAAYTPPVGEQKALPAPAFDISPDVLVYRLPGESKQDYADRVRRALQAAKPGAWAVWPDFTDNVLTIATSATHATVYDMGTDEPWSVDLPEEMRIPSGAEIVPERYLPWLCGTFPKYARNERRKSVHVPADLADIVRASSVCVFLFFSVGIFAQSKTRQVDEALGTRIREIPSAGSRIEYTFREGRREKTYIATGNGSADYTDLLRSTGTGLARFNDEGGVLLFVKKDGEVVAKNTAVGDVATTARPVDPREFHPSTTGDPVRPRPMPGSEPTYTGEPQSFSFPDSMQMVHSIEGMKREFDYRKTELWQVVRPIWAALMYFFWALVPLFICVGGIMNYFAGTAANEGFYGLSFIGQMIRRVHEAASGATLLVCWAVTFVLLLNMFMLFVYSGVSLWYMIAVWFPCIWLAKAATNWAVPNPPDAGSFPQIPTINSQRRLN